MLRPALRLLVLLAVSALSLRSMAAGKPGGPGSVDDAWIKAMKAGDVDAAAKCYASDAVLWMPGEPEARGAKAIHDAYASFLGANTVQDVALFEDHEETLGNVSGRWGNFRMTTVPKKGGAPTTMTGRFTAVLKRRGGRWVYVADHASADPAPAR